MGRSDDDEDFTLKIHPSGSLNDDYSEFVELDPTGRYGRYNKILGKGAYKTVYKAFDELDGIEVAWNQVNIQETLHNSGNMERLYSELHLLKMLKHQNIIKFCNSWVDTRCKNVNFITEIFTSGTLRQYRKKHRHVKLKAIKLWSRQILQGLVYLHSHDPPIIHRDLKCDNIFINGNSGEVKIGDLGLAVILSQAPAAHTVIGTPEFMAPELYEEHYTQLVDIYSFGMCLLEIISFEYPYSECTNAAQIYKKVTAGKRPEALKKVKDPEIRKFVEKCLASASERLSAKELLMDPFLQIEEDQEEDVECCQSVMLDPYDDLKDLCPAIKEPFSWADAGQVHEVRENKIFKEGNTLKTCSFSTKKHLPESPKEKMGWKKNRDFRIKLKQQDETKVLIRFRITSGTGGARFIQFDFDIETDTAMSVACEMVTELDLSDQDANIIAGMIDAELMTLFPDWMPGGWIDDAGGDGKQQGLVKESSEVQELPADDIDGPSVHADGLEVAPDSQNEVLVYGRFEEVGCNLSGSLRTQQELEGLGSFSDFSSEHFEGGGSDLSLDSSFDRLNAEASVREMSIRSNLEGDNADMRLESLKRSEDITKELVTLPTHNKLDGDVGSEELLLLALQQKQEIECLKSKHNQELQDLKTHLEAEANASVDGIFSRKRSSTQAINDSVDPPARDLGETLQRIINEVSPNTCKESMLNTDINLDELDVHGSVTPEVVLEKFESRTIDTNMQIESCTSKDDCMECFSTSEAFHEPESTTKSESKSLFRPERIMKEQTLSTERESFLELYKAGLTQKDKILSSNDVVSKSSESKDGGLDQARKQLLQKSIAELEAKTLEGLSQSSNCYLVKKC